MSDVNHFMLAALPMDETCPSCQMTPRQFNRMLAMFIPTENNQAYCRNCRMVVHMTPEECDRILRHDICRTSAQSHEEMHSAWAQHEFREYIKAKKTNAEPMGEEQAPKEQRGNWFTRMLR